MYIYVYTYYNDVYIYIYVCVFVCMYVCMYMYVYMFMWQIFCDWLIHLLEYRMNGLMARWILTVDILYLLPEAWRSHLSGETWMESYQIVFVIYNVHDLYNCSTLVSGVQHPATL